MQWVNMKQTTRLHDFFHPVVERAIAPCEATPIASQSLLIAGWKKSMRVRTMKKTTPQWLRRSVVRIQVANGMMRLFFHNGQARPVSGR
jgi:hypothetical protein